jgi:hypothetical protein
VPEGQQIQFLFLTEETRFLLPKRPYEFYLAFSSVSIENLSPNSLQPDGEAGQSLNPAGSKEWVDFNLNYPYVFMSRTLTTLPYTLLQ